jgi:hypothetical protein
MSICMMAVPGFRHCPVRSRVIARIAAGVDDEVSFRDDVCSRIPAVESDRAAKKWMVFEHRVFRVERDYDRALNAFRKLCERR